MSFRTMIVVACSVASSLSVPARCQCGPTMEKQIAQVMNTWVEDWNEKRIDDLSKLYYSQAVLLPADGSRADGQNEIRAYLEKQVGTKMELNSPGPGFICPRTNVSRQLLSRVAPTGKVVQPKLLKDAIWYCWSEGQHG